MRQNHQNPITNSALLFSPSFKGWLASALSDSKACSFFYRITSEKHPVWGSLKVHAWGLLLLGGTGCLPGWWAASTFCFCLGDKEMFGTIEQNWSEYLPSHDREDGRLHWTCVPPPYLVAWQLPLKSDSWCHGDDLLSISQHPPVVTLLPRSLFKECASWQDTLTMI